MKKTLLGIGRFFRIIDERERFLSLTNIAVIIVLVKLCFSPVASITDLGTLLIALLAYSTKKMLNNNKPTEMELPDVVAKQLEAIKSSVEAQLQSKDAQLHNIEDILKRVKDKLGIQSLADTLKPKL